MTKTVSRSLVAIFCMVTLVSSAAAQEVALNTKRQDKIFATPESSNTGEIKRMNDVSGKVLKSFFKSFGERPDATWFKTENGFVVLFKDNGITTNVYFSSNGAIEYKVKYYFEDQLPAEVRHTVKSNFYDYSIIHVTEFHKADVVCYLVKIEDKTSVKTIRVIGEGWSVIESLAKQ